MLLILLNELPSFYFSKVRFDFISDVAFIIFLHFAYQSIVLILQFVLDNLFKIYLKNFDFTSYLLIIHLI